MGADDDILSHGWARIYTDFRTRCAGAGLRGVGAHKNLLSPTDGHGFTQIFAHALLVLASGVLAFGIADYASAVMRSSVWICEIRGG